MNIGYGGVRKLLERREDMTEKEQAEAVRRREMQSINAQRGEEVDVVEVLPKIRGIHVGVDFCSTPELD